MGQTRYPFVALANKCFTVFGYLLLADFGESTGNLDSEIIKQRGETIIPDNLTGVVSLTPQPPLSRGSHHYFGLPLLIENIPMPS